MKLVVDTNILFSFFRENPVRQIIINSDTFKLKLYTPEYSIEELLSNKSELLKYAKVSEDELEYAIMSLKLFIEEKPRAVFKEFESEAKRISPDIKDFPFFALALKLGAAIWSNEPRLKKQTSLKVFSTADIMKLLSI